MNSAMQKQYAPDTVSPPGATLADMIMERRMTQAQLALQMKRPKKTINEIIKGKAEITPETALQLEHVLHTPAAFWLRRESAYREHLARREEAKALRGQLSCLKDLPMRAMIDLGWLEDLQDPAARILQVLNFFRVAKPGALQQLDAAVGIPMFRRSTTFQSNPYALAAWLRRGEMEAEKIDTPAYDEVRFRDSLRRVRALSRQPPEVFEPEMRRCCAEAGVVILLVPELPKTCVSGVARWIADRPVIQLSLRHKTDDHLWFTFFHEAAHILQHGRGEIFVDEKRRADDADDTADPKAPEDVHEHEANEAAAEFLVPKGDITRFLATHSVISKASIVTFAAQLGIAPGIVVGHLQHRGRLPYAHCNELKVRLSWTNRT